MALWNGVVSNEVIHLQMKEYYERHGLYGIRSFYAHWIEERVLFDKNQCMELAASRFKEDMQKFISSQISSLEMPNSELHDYFSTVTAISQEGLYSCFNIGIQKEMQLIQMTNTVPLQNDVKKPNDPTFDMNIRLRELAQAIKAFQQRVVQLGMDYEQVQIYINEYSQMQTSPMQDKIREIYNRWYANRTVLVGELRQIVAEFKSLQIGVNNELKEWQRKQALAGNGAPYNDNLDAIQGVTEGLVGISMELLPIITTAQSIGANTVAGEGADLAELALQVRSMQEQIILSSFIVEKQPPQVMKTNTRFAATVRWLIGSALFQRHLNANTPVVDCVILSEAQAQRFCAQVAMSDSTPNASGEILNNMSNMEFQQANRHFSASFRNMQLKKIKRTEKKGTESVMDEKFALLFYTSAVVTDYRVRAWTLSLPVVVIVHGNQEPQSWATITWDNAFADIGREPFQVPERVCWSHLSLALNTKFCSATGRALTEDNLQFLYEKLFRGEMTADQKDYITWPQFCKEALPERSFTFWDWFFAIMKLTKDHLLGPWKAGRIVGFINKRKTTDEILSQCQAGTFLLRFSDSELGGITAAFVNNDRNVYMLQPWTAKDLNVLGLADRIKDLNVLQYLYPNIPKVSAFSGFCTPPAEVQKIQNGYVRNTIKACCEIDSTTSPRSTPSPTSQSMASPSSSVMQQSNANEPMYSENTIDFNEFFPLSWNTNNKM